MRKMTQKEFIDTIYDVMSRTRKISNYEDILNTLSILLDDSCENSQRKAEESEDEKTKKIHTDYANTQRRRANKIFQILDERGFYNRD